MKIEIAIVIIAFLAAALFAFCTGCAAPRIASPKTSPVTHVDDLSTRPVIIDLTERLGE